MPFEIPDSWEWTKVGNIAFVTKLAGFEYTSHIAPNIKSKGTPLFKGKNVQDGNLIYEFDGYISEELSNELERSQINRKCLLTPYVGTIGNIAIFPGDFKAHLGSNVGKIELFNRNSINVLEEFVVYFFRSNTGYSELTKYKKATAQESISIEAIRNAYIPVPPLPEQHRIVAKIEELLPYITEYEKTEKNLTALNAAFPDQLKKSILQQAVQGKLVPQGPNDEPASVLLERIRAEKQELIKAGKIKKDKNESVIFKRDNSHYELCNGIERCIDDEIPFEIPESWCWARCSSLGAIIRGSGIKRTETIETGAPCIRYGEIYTSYNRSFTNTVSFIPKELFDQCKHISKDDVVFTLTGENKPDIAKAIAYLGDEHIAAGGDLAFWTHHGMNPLYLVYFMSCPYAINRKIDLATGDIIVHISGEKIGSILIPVTPINEQNRIVEQIDNLTSIIAEL